MDANETHPPPRESEEASAASQEGEEVDEMPEIEGGPWDHAAQELNQDAREKEVCGAIEPVEVGR